MKVKTEFHVLLENLRGGIPIAIEVGGIPIKVALSDEREELLMSAQVYLGGDYIPRSVRYAISKKLPQVRYAIDSFFTINEEEFEITLNHFEAIESLCMSRFSFILEEFSTMATEWRSILDENDQDDLIPVHYK